MKAYSMGTHRKKFINPFPLVLLNAPLMYTLKMNHLTRLCRLPPWLTGGNSRLRMGKNGVAVGKVDLVFVLLYGTVHFGLSP